MIAEDHALAINQVTLHDGQWAFCPSGASSEHEWAPVPPVPVEEVKFRLAKHVRSEVFERQ